MSRTALRQHLRDTLCNCSLHTEPTWVTKSVYYVHRAREQQLLHNEEPGPDDGEDEEEEEEASVISSNPDDETNSVEVVVASDESPSSSDSQSATEPLSGSELEVEPETGGVTAESLHFLLRPDMQARTVRFRETPPATRLFQMGQPPSQIQRGDAAVLYLPPSSAIEDPSSPIVSSSPIDHSVTPSPIDSPRSEDAEVPAGFVYYSQGQSSDEERHRVLASNSPATLTAPPPSPASASPPTHTSADAHASQDIRMSDASPSISESIMQIAFQSAEVELLGPASTHSDIMELDCTTDTERHDSAPQSDSDVELQDAEPDDQVLDSEPEEKDVDVADHSEPALSDASDDMEMSIDHLVDHLTQGNLVSSPAQIPTVSDDEGDGSEGVGDVQFEEESEVESAPRTEDARSVEEPLDLVDAMEQEEEFLEQTLDMGDLLHHVDTEMTNAGGGDPDSSDDGDGSDVGSTPPPSSVDSRSTDRDHRASSGEEYEDEDDQSRLTRWFTTHILRDEFFQRLHAHDPELRLAIGLLHWKTRKQISDVAFEDLRKVLHQHSVEVPGLKTIERRLAELTGIQPKRFDVCAKSHMMFTGRDARRRWCECGEARFVDERDSDDDDTYHREHLSDSEDTDVEIDHGAPTRARTRKTRKPKSWCSYFPLIPTLYRSWQDPRFARQVKEHRLYHDAKENPLHPKHGVIEDFHDGLLYKMFLKQKGLMSDVHDLVFGVLIDGFHVLREKNTHSVFTVLLINYSLPSDVRMRKENLIVLMVIPGPKEPDSLRSWFRPIMREFGHLNRGCDPLATDGDTGERFRMRAWLVSALGDQKALNTLIQMRGANSKFGCRFCWVEGKLFRRQYYYPVDGPNVVRARWRRIIKEIIADGRKTLKMETGVRGLSVLIDMPAESIHFPRGTPYGPMHAVILNQWSKMMMGLWRGEHSFDGGRGRSSRSASVSTRERSRSRSRKSSSASSEKSGPDAESAASDAESSVPGVRSDAEYIIDAATWDVIGKEVEEASKTVPAVLARSLRHICTHKYTAAGWTTFILHYAIPVFWDRLPLRCLRNVVTFVEAYELLLRKEHTAESIAQMREKWLQFVRDYDSVYVQYVYEGESVPDAERVKLRTTNLHALMHLADHLEDFGNVANFWEYAVERLGDMLKSMIRSRLHVSEGLTNAVMIQEQVKVAARVFPELGLPDRLANMEAQPAGAYPTDHGFLLKRRVHIDLNDTEWRQTHHLLLVYFNRLARKSHVAQGSFTIHPQAVYYERYKLGQGGHIVGSTESQLLTPTNRASHYIAFTGSGGEEVYGEVEFFLKLHVNGLRRPGVHGKPTTRTVRDESEGFSQTDSTHDSDGSEWVSDYDRQFEHYLALVTRWNTDTIELEGGGYTGVLFESAGDEEVVEVRHIKGLVGRFTSAGRHWIVNAGSHTILNLVEDQF